MFDINRTRFLLFGVMILMAIIVLYAQLSRPIATMKATPVAMTMLATNEPQPTENQTYTWQQVVSRDSIEPIYDPVFLPADEIKYKADELVIGVEINGDARAYAIGPLSIREMVNDTVGDIPILVTW